MKKTIILGGILCVLASYSASAQVNVIFGQPRYVQPPVYDHPYVYDEGYTEYYRRYPYYAGRKNKNRHENWSYWAHERSNGQNRGNDHDNRNHNR